MDSRDQQLEPDELVRYSRQMRLPSLGLAGQQTLKRSSVLIVGAGGLGSPAAMYLAAAGVGRIGIADDDQVDVTNLHRQPLHDTGDVGLPKAESARARMEALNPFVRVEAIRDRVASDNAIAMIERYDIVIDATDNFATRYLLNDACVLTGTPLVYGSVDRFEGQASVFATQAGPCYRCLFPTPPDPATVQSCADAGVLGVLPGLIGTMQATEALKLLLGLGESLAGRLLIVDALGGRFKTIEVERDPRCPACGTREIRTLIDYDAFCASPVSIRREAAIAGTILPRELSSLLNHGEAITVIDVREPYEWNIGRIPTARLMPLGSMPDAAEGIDRDSDIVVYCHHGVRSDLAAQDLVEVGFRHVRNLIGGIDRWSREVDPRVPRY